MDSHYYPLVRDAVLTFVFVGFTSVVAYMKGFRVRYWFLAAGPVGLLVLAFLPSATDSHLSREQRQARLKRANLTGFVLSCLGLAFLISWFVVYRQAVSQDNRWFQAPPPREDVGPASNLP